MSISNKKIAMIIAPQDFRDEEYFIPRQIFEEQGLKVTTFSSKKGQALSTYGGVVEIKQTLDQLKVESFDALVFCGGSGAQEYIQNQTCWQVARKAIKQSKVLAAICIAPLILAMAGVLEGKKATVWSSALNKQPVRDLKSKGAKYVARRVVIDGSIITANGPEAAREFANAILKALMA